MDTVTSKKGEKKEKNEKPKRAWLLHSTPPLRLENPEHIRESVAQKIGLGVCVEDSVNPIYRGRAHQRNCLSGCSGALRAAEAVG